MMLIGGAVTGKFIGNTFNFTPMLALSGPAEAVGSG
jgi:hypothetical protein